MTIEAAAVAQLKAVCDDITKEHIDKLVVNPNWGTINFEKVKVDLETIFGIAHQLKNLPLELLPEQDFGPLRDSVVPILIQIESIRKFSIDQGNAPGVRDGIVNTLRQQTVNLYANAQLRIPFLALQRGDVRRNEEKLGRVVAEADKLLETSAANAKTKGGEIDSIIAAAREASASVGVAHFTGDFNTAASKLDTAAGRWLTCTAILGVITVVGALAFPFIFPAKGDTFDMASLQLFTSKLVALGALFTSTVWTGHMYKATKHQAAVNHHRSNALKTFQAFVKATNDDQTRNAVLMETTRSIFALTNTGYLDAVENPGDGALKILEVVKTAASAGK